jgi:hypothetical protein
MPVLLRNLLADRFKLRAHTETKTVQGFALTAVPIDVIVVDSVERSPTGN